MPTLLVIACGGIKEAYVRDGIADYGRRLSRYAQVDIVEVSDVPDSYGKTVQLEREAAALLQKIPPRAYVIALDMKGTSVDTERFAAVLEHGFRAGDATVCFVIGGSNGLARSVLERADLRLSFSALTFPHQLMRLILLEQCYRAFKINRGEPYHK